jgi:uncharacterized protein
MKQMLDLKTPMRDGVKLSMNVYRPDVQSACPTILLRTPYIKERAGNEWVYANAEELTQFGYNVAFQDARGTGQSDGVLASHGGSEVDDGYDTIEWIAAQPWCDGHVGMFGLSYFGYAQLAAAENNPPHLDTICPFQNAALYPLSITKANTFGCYHLMWLYGRVLDSLEHMALTDEEKQRVREQIAYYTEHWNKELLYLPTRDIPAAKIPGIPLLNDFVELVDGVEDPEYWRKAHRPIRLSGIDMPMFFLSGWFDGARDGTFDNYQEVMAHGTDKARRNSRLVIGPWVHGGNLQSQLDGMDFGQENSGEGKGVRRMIREWFDRWLKSREDSEPYAPISLFVLGDNCWRDEQEWPPLRAVETPWYLHGDTDGKHGLLNVLPAGNEAPDRFTYDPEDPQPSKLRDDLGRTLFADPSYLDERTDVLTYITEPLSAEMEVTGCVHLRLFASTDVTDTDFFARMCDVDADNRAFPLLDGIVRGRFRNSRTPEPLLPGQTYEFSIELGNISNVFMAGHRVKIALSSSSFPTHDRNLNTGERIGWGTMSVVAHQTIFHDAQNPSRLILPVIPR